MNTCNVNIKTKIIQFIKYLFYIIFFVENFSRDRILKKIKQLFLFRSRSIHVAMVWEIELMLFVKGGNFNFVEFRNKKILENVKLDY